MNSCKGMKKSPDMSAGLDSKRKDNLPPSVKREKVMREFKGGKLFSSSGEKVVDPRQAVAISYSEARNQ